MKYLKLFNTLSEYNTLIDNLYKPNVSFIKEEGKTYCHPLTPNSFSGVINVEEIGSDYAFFSEGALDINLISRMKVDGIEVERTSFMSFSTPGKHNFYIELSEPISTMESMFEEFSWLVEVDFRNFDTSLVESLNRCFFGCTSLESVKMRNMDFKNVTDMRRIFNYCSSLTSLDVSGWDVSNVIEMSRVFSECSNLADLKGYEDWNISNATSIYDLFSNCSYLTKVDLSKWDTTNVTDMENLFSGCKNLVEIRMGGNVSNVSLLNGIFDNISLEGTFYYNSAYDYSVILAELPSTWTAIPCTLLDGVLVPNN
jgi:surface protein